MNSRNDSLSGMGRRAGKARLMSRARDQQRDGEDDLGSDREVNLSWQGRFPFAHFQSGLVISTIQAKYTGISNLLIKSPLVCSLLCAANASLLVLALAGHISWRSDGRVKLSGRFSSTSIMRQNSIAYSTATHSTAERSATSTGVGP